MNLRQRTLLAQKIRNVYGFLVKNATFGKLVVEDDEVSISTDGNFRSLTIYFKGALSIENNLPNGYSMKINNKCIRIRNYMARNIKNDNILFKFRGLFLPESCVLYDFNTKLISVDIFNKNNANIINHTRTKLEDFSLILRGEETDIQENNTNFALVENSIDDDGIYGLYTKKPFENGYVGYYNYHPKEKVYMTGKNLTEESNVISSNIKGLRAKANIKAKTKLYSKLLNRTTKAEKKEVIQKRKPSPITPKSVQKKKKTPRGGY